MAITLIVDMTAARVPFLFNGEFPPHCIEPLARVARVGNRAWPLSRFSGGIREIKEAGVTLTWEGQQASALDQTSIATSRKSHRSAHVMMRAMTLRMM